MGYSANELILNYGGVGAFDEVGCIPVASVIKAKDVYHLFYAGVRAGDFLYQGGLATSKNGIGFTKSPNNPVIPLGGAGAPDESSAYPAGAIYIDDRLYQLRRYTNAGKWYVFYIGVNSGGGTTLCWGVGRNPDSLQKQGVLITPPGGYTFATVCPVHVEYGNYKDFNKKDLELEMGMDEIFYLRYMLFHSATTKYSVRLAQVKLW